MSSGSLPSEEWKGAAGPSKEARHKGRQRDLPLPPPDCRGSRSERSAWSEVEGDGGDRKLILVIDGQRRRAGFQMGKRAERNRSGRALHVDVLQPGRRAPELRVRLEHDVV